MFHLKHYLCIYTPDPNYLDVFIKYSLEFRIFVKGITLYSSLLWQ